MCSYLEKQQHIQWYTMMMMMMMMVMMVMLSIMINSIVMCRRYIEDVLLRWRGHISSVQFKMVSMRSVKPIQLCAPPRLSEVPPTLPLKQFQCSSDWRWSSLVLSRKVVSRFLFPRLSPPGDQWCDVLGFMPAGSVSSFSALEIFWEAIKPLVRLHCLHGW